MVTVEVFGTGSEGNCALLGGDLLMDCGLPRGRVPVEAVRRASALLVTHEHGDHLNPATVRWMCGENRAMSRQLFMNASTLAAFAARCPDAALASKVRAVAAGDSFEVRSRSGTWRALAFECPHGGVENVGFHIVAPDGTRVLWATDVQTMRHAPVDALYDLICLEGNYDVARLDEALRDPSRCERAEQNRRHLSVQAFERFVSQHAAPGARVVQLHVSGEYGTASPLADACP